MTPDEDENKDQATSQDNVITSKLKGCYRNPKTRILGIVTILTLSIVIVLAAVLLAGKYSGFIDEQIVTFP